MSDPNRVIQQLERLIIELLPPQKVEKNLQNYLKYFQRILSSRISPSEQDESSLKTLITQKIFSTANENNTQKHTANTSALRAQELMQRLSRIRILYQKPAILFLLYKLANTGKTIQKASVGALESLFQNREEIKKPIKGRESGGNAMEIEKPNLNLYGGKNSGSENFAQQTIKKVTNKGNDAINLTENDILRDVLYVFHAIDGHYVNFNSSENCFSIKTGIPLQDPVRNLVNSLCEIGYLYKKLNIFLSKQHPGLIRQAFAMGIKEELNDYFKLLALLENLRLENEENNNNNSPNLSLRKLALWIIEPLERMKWLNIMSDSVSELIGGDVLSSVFSYQRQGSPTVQQLVNRILVNINQPFLKYVHLWIYQGVLTDNIGEFFVAENENETEIWNSKYSLIHSRIPSFLSHKFAEKIFLAGKTVNFMKKCCKIKEWSLYIDPFDTKDFSQITKFEEWVLLCSNIINQKLLETLFLDYSLEKHLSFLKKYLLMGQGDLIQNLMDILTNELNKPASQIFRHQLMGYLEMAIRASNAQYHSNDFVNRLEIKLLEASPGDTGWDIFSLDYRVETPISTIFHPKIMRKYLQIFNFLWRVKRVEFCLHGVWINHMKASQYLTNLASIKKLFHKCHLLRNEMIHFIDNLFNYLMVEVIEATWGEFKEKIPHVKELNELIEIHETCIDKILEKALLKERTETIYKHLLKVFELIYRLKFTQEILLSKAQEQYSFIKHQEKQKEIERIVGEDSSMMQLESSEISFPKEFHQQNAQIIDTITKDYMEALFNFQNLLRKEENLVNLKFLSFRLDFNEYYNNQPSNKFSNMSNIFPAKGFFPAGGPLEIPGGKIINKPIFDYGKFQEKNEKSSIYSEENQYKLNREIDINMKKNQGNTKVMESIFTKDMEEEEDDFLQEGEDEEFESSHHNSDIDEDLDRTNSFRKK